jgi:hypothetical protein
MMGVSQVSGCAGVSTGGVGVGSPGKSVDRDDVFGVAGDSYV